MSGLDITARGIASAGQAMVQPLAGRAFGHVGTRIFGGRMAGSLTNSSGYSHEVLLAMAAPWDAVRLIYAAGQATGLNAATSTLSAAVMPVAGPSDADSISAQSARGWLNVSFSGGSSVSYAPPAATMRRAFYLSDWMIAPSVPRADGGALPLLLVRTYLAASGGNPLVLLGNGAQSFANWAAHPSGRLWRMRSMTGVNYATAGQNNLTSGSAATANISPLVGVQVLSRGKVVNIFGFGDSITEGQGSYIGEGFGFPAAVALSANAAGIAYEWSNLGWAGISMTGIRDEVSDAIGAGLVPDLAVISGGSPNEIGTTIADTNIAATRGKLAQALATLAGKGVPAIVSTWMPSNSAAKGYGATDSLRRAYNADLRGWAARGGVIADFDALAAGTDPGSGEVQLKAGFTDDGIHPNDAGNAALALLLRRAVGRVAQPAAGMLVA